MPASLPTTAAGAIALVLLGLQWTVGKKKVKPLAVFLAVAAGAGLIEGTIGPWVRRKLARVTTAALDAIQSSITNAEISQIVAVFASVAMICIALIVTIWTIARVVDNKVDDRTLLLSAATPVAVNLLPGALAGFLAGILSFPPHAVGAALAWGLGGG